MDVLVKDLFDLSAPWRTHAACLGLDGGPFFIEDHAGRGGYATAKAICAICFVTADCLNYALETRMEEGVWGGLSPRERRRVRARRKTA